MFAIEPVRTREDGLRRLLAARGVEAGDWALDGDALVLPGGRRAPLFAWRTHFHNVALRSLIHQEGNRNPSALRLLCARDGRMGLPTMLAQELDLSEWLMGARTVRAFALAAGNVLHATTRLDSGVVCTFELNAGLPAGSAPVYKHEMTGETGFVTDRAVDEQLAPQPLYLYEGGAQPQGFSDVDVENYGLSPEDATDVRAACALLIGEEDIDRRIEEAARLERLCALIWASARTGQVMDAREVTRA